MYQVSIERHFDAAHFLRDYNGKCENLHGHNWKVEVYLQADKLDDLGMVMDFGQLKEYTKGIMDKLDHKNINDLEYFKTHNPSSEEIARYIFNELKSNIQEKNCLLEEVRVWETDTSCATYQE